MFLNPNLSDHPYFVVYLCRQGPVGSQHSEPDTHGDQHKEGGRREGEQREEELALRRGETLSVTRLHVTETIPGGEGRCRVERRRWQWGSRGGWSEASWTGAREVKDICRFKTFIKLSKVKQILASFITPTSLRSRLRWGEGSQGGCWRQQSRPRPGNRWWHSPR